MFAIIFRQFSNFFLGQKFKKVRLLLRLSGTRIYKIYRPGIFPVWLNDKKNKNYLLSDSLSPVVVDAASNNFK